MEAVVTLSALLLMIRIEPYDHQILRWLTMGLVATSVQSATDPFGLWKAYHTGKSISIEPALVAQKGKRRSGSKLSILAALASSGGLYNTEPYISSYHSYAIFPDYMQLPFHTINT